MRGYGQYCPIARGAEIFATRWTPIIVRNLLAGCTTFGEIREGAPGISTAVLSARLRQLECHGIVRRTPNPSGRGARYELTDAGAGLGEVCTALGIWGARWLELAPEHLDAHTVLWTVCRLMDTAALPRDRVVVRFDVRDARTGRFWILARRDGAEVCVKPPGHDADLVVRADSRALVDWQMGWVPLGNAQRAGTMVLEGPVWARRELARWGGRHPFGGPRGARPGPPPGDRVRPSAGVSGTGRGTAR